MADVTTDPKDAEGQDPKVEPTSTDPATGDKDTSTEEPKAPEQEPKSDDEQLGESGKKALEAERTEKNKLKAELAELRESSVTKEDHSKVVEERDALAKRVEEFEAKETAATQRQSVLDAAKAAGARNPNLVARLVDYGRLSDSTTAEDLIAEVKADAETADLFGEAAPATQPGLGNQGGEPTPPSVARKSFTVEELNTMSDAEYLANKDAIVAWQRRSLS